MSRVLIGYPTGWTLAVVDDPAGAERVAADLRSLTASPDDVVVIEGGGATEQLRRLGASSGVLARMRRSVQFTMMDQLPDFVVYESALEQGRAVVGVRAGGAGTQAVNVLRRGGAHFINRFGALMTAEIEPWHGTLPPIPQHMHR
jgi:hypothetical protein